MYCDYYFYDRFIEMVFNIVKKEKVREGIIKIMEAEANGSLYNGYKKSKRNIPYNEWMKEALLNEMEL